jgi:membrane fusion protein, multidrug efflux system
MLNAEQVSPTQTSREQPRKPGMRKRMIIMLLLTGLVLAAVFGFEAFKAMMIRKFMATSNPPQTVSTMVAASTEWHSQIEAVGSVRAVNGANLSAQVAGTVSATHFQSGANVNKGDVLLELESADDVVHLAALKATAALAQITYDRDRALVKSNAVSQQTVDTDEGNLKNAKALVEQQQALPNYKTHRRNPRRSGGDRQRPPTCSTSSPGCARSFPRFTLRCRRVCAAPSFTTPPTS